MKLYQIPNTLYALRIVVCTNPEVLADEEIDHDYLLDLTDANYETSRVFSDWNGGLFHRPSLGYRFVHITAWRYLPHDGELLEDISTLQPDTDYQVASSNWCPDLDPPDWLADYAAKIADKAQP
jgi:hypothetical protein